MQLVNLCNLFYFLINALLLCPNFILPLLFLIFGRLFFNNTQNSSPSKIRVATEGCSGNRARMQVYKYVSIQEYKYTSIQVYKYTSIQVYKNTSIQEYKNTSI